MFGDADGFNKNTRLYILGCKIGCLICKTLIFNVYCGADGTTSYYLLCFAKLINLLIIQHIHQLFKYNYIAPYCSILHRFAIIWVEFWVDLL